MAGFRNILVGIDLTRSEHGDVAAPDAFGENAIRQARWVARESRAPLTFLSVLPEPRGQGDEAARRALADLVRRAEEEGLDARAVLAHGEPSAEINRQVVREGHDLLVAGTHDPQGLRRLFFGSTAGGLLHECPCAVWVVKSGNEIPPRRVLVASDLSPLSDRAVRLGITLATLAGGRALVLEVVEYPLDRLRWTGDTDAATAEYHRRIRAEAEQGIEAQLARCGHAQSPTTTVHVAEGQGCPDLAILGFIRGNGIDLVVLGTAARHGLSGLLLGSTAERLLPEAPCSMLVVEAADFRPPAPA